jgi:hypothetical protein
LATTGGKTISHDATIELTISSLRQAGVYGRAITTWEDKEIADQTWANFQLHFDKQEKLRLKKLTAAAAGYHGNNSANFIPPDTAEPPSAALAAASHINGGQNCEGEPVFYC